MMIKTVMKMKTIFAAAALLLLVFAPVPAASAQDLVILHTNDTHSDYNQGTPYFTVFGGDLEMEVMNALGYEVVAIGNHEYDNGVDELARRLSKAEFQTVCANYDFSGTALDPLVKPYVIVEKAGKKIGIFGLTVPLRTLVARQNLKGIVYMDAFASADKWADYRLSGSGQRRRPCQGFREHRHHHRRPQPHLPQDRPRLQEPCRP